MSNERVDVLAVMAKARGTELATEMWVARCAVAELIEADRELDAASMAVHQAACGRTNAAAIIAAGQRRNAAISRRAKALLRIGGIDDRTP